MPPLTVASLQTITHSLAADAADAGDDARGGDVVVVHAVRRELRELEERAARIEQRAHALARQQLAARRVLGAALPRRRLARSRAIFARRSATSAAIASRFCANAASRVLSRDSMTGIGGFVRREPAADGRASARRDGRQRAWPRCAPASRAVADRRSSLRRSPRARTGSRTARGRRSSAGRRRRTCGRRGARRGCPTRSPRACAEREHRGIGILP